MPQGFVMLAFLNSCTTEGVSGGDVRFIETARRLKDYNKVVVTSLSGKRLCERRGLDAKYLITTREKYVKNVLLTYCKRIIRALSMKIEIKPCDIIIYSTSDFLPDVFPAFVYKLRNSKVKWISAVYLIIPSPFKDFSQYFIKDKFTFPTINIALYFFSQKVGLFLMKHFSDAILVLNKWDKRYLVREQGVDERKVFAVNMGVDNKEIKGVKTEKKDYAGVFIGRFHPQKGIFDLIKIWKLVCIKKPGVRLALIGSGPKDFTYELISEIKKEDLSKNIDLLGFKDGRDKIRILKSSKAFLFPSTYESWGAVAGEAMASGLPVVAYDLPIFKDIFPKGMIRVPIGDIKRFANQVLNLLNDQRFYEKISKEALNMASQYDWDTVAKEELKILEGLFDN